MPKRERTDLPDETELSVSSSTWLRWYERHLRQILNARARGEQLEREDLELLLFDRSDLERSLRASPKALTPAEKRKLGKLDEELKKLAPLIKALIPDLAETKRSLNVTRSHLVVVSRRRREKPLEVKFP